MAAAIRETRETMAPGRPRPFTILLILICILAPVYSNTLHVPWHYDDQPNIVGNQRLHLKEINLKSVGQTFFAQAGKDRFFRPLSSLSFAVNWYVGGDDPFGYHIVNIGVHILTAFFLYLTIFQLFGTPALIRRFTVNDAVFISLFGAVLWAVNPIQTQAVTYIVQRMAQMAALFYAAGLFFYLKARLASPGSGRGYWILAGLMFLAGVFSKENAIMFPAALFLLEILFFSDSGSSGRRRYFLWGCAVVLAGIAGLMLFAGNDPLFFLGGYQGRPFSFSERMLTEPRIVLFYLSQIFYPLPSRLSVTHDVLVSRSLFYPWTTLSALILIAALIALAVLYRRRFPLFSFALLFYFLNHVVESTVIPLELIFEHRNYLPSLFLFVPVMAGLSRLLARYQSKNRFVFSALVICVLTVIVGFGRFAYERNRVWQSPETLWYDAMKKAPGQAGPVNNVAVAIGWKENASGGEKELALRLLNRALEKEHPSLAFRSRIYDNIGSLSAELGKWAAAEEAFRRAIALDPGFLKARHNLARFLARSAQWEKALAAAGELIKVSGKKARADYHETRGLILLWMNESDRALLSFHQALVLDPYNFPSTLLYTGCALSRAGEYDRAQWFYKLAQAGRPLQALTFFLLIENSVRAGDSDAAEQYARVLFSEFDGYDIFKTLKRLPEPGRTVPLDKALVAPVIKTVFGAIGREAQDKAIIPR